MSKIMDEELYRKMDAVMATLVDKAEAHAAYFCDRGGNVIAQKALRTYAMEDNLVALCAGAFYATQQVSRLVGDPEFDMVIQKGRNTSILMQSMDEEHMLLIITDSGSNSGLAKFFAARAKDELVALATAFVAAPVLSGAQTFEIDMGRDAFRRA